MGNLRYSGDGTRSTCINFIIVSEHFPSLKNWTGA
jgi:hypothetical protein